MVKLQIVLDPRTGRMQVGGPIEDKGLCLRMLDEARKQVAAYQPQPQGIQIAPAEFLKTLPVPTKGMA